MRRLIRLPSFYPDDDVRDKANLLMMRQDWQMAENGAISNPRTMSCATHIRLALRSRSKPAPVSQPASAKHTVDWISALS
jgi:hypothetical protein